MVGYNLVKQTKCIHIG